MTTRTLAFGAPSILAHLSIAHAVRGLRRSWHKAARAAATRRNLARLDERMLADIGISAAQAEFEASRWH